MNWQMSKATSSALYTAKSDKERSDLCRNWLSQTKIADRFKPRMATGQQMTILQQFTDLNCDFATKQQKFTEQKMSAFMEIMHYAMR